MERHKHPPVGVFEGKNFMTPTLLETGKLSEMIWYEISKGRGIENEPIFGVTIRDTYGHNVPGYASKLFWSRSQALSYLEDLAERMDM